MAETIQCDLCSEPATVHLTQIVDAKIHKVDLCETCAKEKGVTDPNGFSLADLLAGNMETERFGKEPLHLKCDDCGFTPKDYKKHGRLGCPSCYENLRPMIMPMLAHMHKGTAHDGKIPHHTLTREEQRQKLDDLNASLRKAVAEERFEDAARIRDAIIQQIEEDEGAHVH